MKILVLFTGGTIGSTKENNIISPNRKSKRVLIQNYKNDDGILFDEMQPYFALSENNSGKTVSLLIHSVSENINRYDGIIITHGTDTIQYSAAALSFALGSNTVPVVFVSANYPLEDERSNGNDNFKGAVDFMKTQSGKGVFVCYKNSDQILYIHRGSRLLAHNEFDDNLFSIKNQYFGIMKNGKFIPNEKYTAKADEIKPFGNIELNTHSDIKTVFAKVGEDYKGNVNNTFLLKTYHSGTLPTSNQNFQKFAKNNNIFISGFDRKTVYESAAVYQDLGFNILPVSAFISSYMKLWLAKSLNLPLKEIMQKSLGEDIIE